MILILDLLMVHWFKDVLRLNPVFLSKVTNVDYLKREIELETFSPHPNNRVQTVLRKLCSVGVLWFYLAKTEGFCKDRQF